MKLEREIGILLRRDGLTLATAESCTGGLIAHRITNIAGSSDYFERGYVVYSNRAKTELLGVPPELIQRHGAVSTQVARAMAEGARRASGADLTVAVTGIAGPTADNSSKPVGLVYIALCTEADVRVEEHLFEGTRLQIKSRSADHALRMLLEKLSQTRDRGGS